MKSLKIAVVALVLVGYLSSCAKNTETGGDVPYKPCPCEEEKPSMLVSNIFQGEAYLFKNSIPELMAKKIYTESDSPRKVCSIVFCEETNLASIYFYNLSYPDKDPASGEICNYPDFAKEWTIPKNGCKVIIEGELYLACHPYGVGVGIYIDLILTSFKRK